MNNLDIRVFEKLPVYAVDIRNEVFVKEQGFQEEFDTDDQRAIHVVGFIDDRSVATSRILKNDDGSFIIGRIAVRKVYRKSGLGARIIKASEDIIRKLGGRDIYIHSQLQASTFYEKQGYVKTGETDFEEGCPHCMMRKII
jgi:predicted GNAT family N-acyltransferase